MLFDELKDAKADAKDISQKLRLLLPEASFDFLMKKSKRYF